MRSVQLQKWVSLWTIAAVTATSVMNAAAQDAAPSTENTNRRKEIVVYVQQPNPSAIVTDERYRYSIWQNIDKAQRVIADSLLQEVENQFRRIFDINDRVMTNRVLSEAEWKLMFDGNGSATPLQIGGADYVAGVYVNTITFNAEVESKVVDLGPLGKRRVSAVFADSSFRFSVRFVDARTGRTLWNQPFEGKHSFTKFDMDKISEQVAYDAVVGAARKAVEKLGEYLAREYPPMLRVLAVTPSGNYILSVGKREGLRPGDHLQLAQLQRTPRADGKDYITHQPVGIVRVISVNDEDACEVAVVGEANAQIRSDAEYTFNRTAPPKRNGRR